MGAIVTCPLEVVKTRQQSSNSGFHQLPQIAQEPPGGSQTTCRTVYPAQRRRLWTTTRHSRPQVVALSGYVRSSSNSMTIVQCLKHIIKHEGPMALFKGNVLEGYNFYICDWLHILVTKRRVVSCSCSRTLATALRHSQLRWVFGWVLDQVRWQLIVLPTRLVINKCGFLERDTIFH